MKWPADRISQGGDKSFGMYQKALALAEQHGDLIHLEVGRPSFDTPGHIKEATKRALDEGKVHYGDFQGDLNFRRALAKKVSEENKVSVAEDEIIVTNGLTHGVFAVCMAALNPGDEVILLEPYYPQHIHKVEVAGAVVVTAPLDENFRINCDLIEMKITAKTRMIALVNPSNPTGRVFTRDELEALANLAKKHDLLVLADEVYEQIVFDDARHISIASLPGMSDRTITQFAFTKGYAMDGWRLGYLAAPKKFIDAILQVTINNVAHVNVFIQEGGLAAITGSQDCVREMLEEDRRRRDLLVGRLNCMPNVVCTVPEGSIYAFPDISATGYASQELAEKILHDTHVVVEAGAFYGDRGEGHLRICFGSENYERIEQALDRLDKFFASPESSNAVGTRL